MGIVIYGYGLANSPSLINAAVYMANAGLAVDIFTCGTFLDGISFDRGDIRLVDIPKPRAEAQQYIQKAWRCVCKVVRRGFDRLRSRDELIEREVAALTGSAAFFASILRGKTRGIAYKYFIGVEPVGMMVACDLADKHGIASIYYNMELHLDTDRDVGPAALKIIERQHNRRTLLTITQDEVRKHLLIEQNGLAGDSVLLLPVCADGEPFRIRTAVLQETLGLSPEKKIVLYAGFIADWAMCEELAIAAQSWPADWVLVFHGHGYHDAAYLRKVRKHASEKVRFSPGPVPYEQLSELLASADVGVALYRDLGENFTLIGSASGKLAHYLRSGLPVIVNRYPSISSVVDRYGCGCAVENPSQVGGAVRRILSNHEQMRAAAFRCYEDNYMFSKHFGAVFEKLEGLC